MSHTILSTTTSARDRLLAQEARLVIALADVRSSLNLLLPISALPDEIFEQIFTTCISWLTHFPKRTTQRPDHLLAWTHVCRAWRNLALNCPRLWSTIDLFALNTQLALTFLDRSGSSPISVSAAYRLGTHAQRTSHLFLAFQPHAERLSCIDLTLFPDDIQVFFECVPWSELKNVSSLSLKVPPVSSNFRLSFPEALPKLTKLTLDGVAVPWNTCFQQGKGDGEGSLSHFSLSGLTAEFSPTISQLHSIFRVSSGIQYLRLENISPSSLSSPSESDSSPEPPILEPIQLPHLQDLILTFSKPSSLLPILSLISLHDIPNPPNIQLSCPSFKDITSFLPLHHLSSLGSTLRLGKQLTRILRSDSESKSKTIPWNEDGKDVLLSLTSTQSSRETRSSEGSPTRSEDTSSVTPTGTSVDHPHLRFLLSPQLYLFLSNLTSLELSMNILAPFPSSLSFPSSFSSSSSSSSSSSLSSSSYSSSNPRRNPLIQRFKFSSSPPSSSTRTIYSSSSSSAAQITQEELSTFLEHTSNLEEIRVALNDIDGLLYTLLRPPSSCASGDSNGMEMRQRVPVLCPKLKSLHFGHTGYLWYNFYESDSSSGINQPPWEFRVASQAGEEGDEERERSWLELLHEIITSRRSEEGVEPITKVSFVRCEGITPQVVRTVFGDLMDTSSSPSPSSSSPSSSLEERERKTLTIDIGSHTESRERLNSLNGPTSTSTSSSSSSSSLSSFLSSSSSPTTTTTRMTRRPISTSTSASTSASTSSGSGPGIGSSRGGAAAVALSEALFGSSSNGSASGFASGSTVAVPGAVPSTAVSWTWWEER